MKSSLFDQIIINIIMLILSIFLITKYTAKFELKLLLVAIIILFSAMITWIFCLISDIKKIIKFASEVQNGNYLAQAYIFREDEIGDLYKHIYSMKEKLRISNHTKENMIQNISHNLKTPLSVISLTTELIKEGSYPDGTLDASCNRIIETTKSMYDQINRLMKINRIEYKKSVNMTTTVKVNMKQLINELISEMDQLFINKKIELILHLYNVEFTGDKNDWKDAVQNILENAIRYAESKIIVELNRTSLVIINDGSSIEENLRQIIFEPYSAGTNGKTGLGLAISKEVAELYGYKIEAFNLDDGVEFKIYN